MQKVEVTSEIGKIKKVIVHTPGAEVEKMTPENAERALYSDILNLSVASVEYQQFKGVLNEFCEVFEVKDLLYDILSEEKERQNLIDTICSIEGNSRLSKYLLSLTSTELSNQLIEGVEIKRDNLTKYLSEERYSLKPLHNFLFTRDASITLFNEVLIGKMASNVRLRETLIMDAIFRLHPQLNVKTIKPGTLNTDEITIEGGDVLIARDDVLIIGTGTRTSSQGIDSIIEHIRTTRDSKFHIVVQELPSQPESFIHLDMVFTFLDKNQCMVYEPLIMNQNKFRTIHITIENKKVKQIRTEHNLLSALKKLNFDLEPITCGGKNEIWDQEREQWHSGANFFALAPGIIIGYERNVHTIEELNNKGYQVIKAIDIINKKVAMPQDQRAVITIAGSELARGGGGARCMTMPVLREKVFW